MKKSIVRKGLWVALACILIILGLMLYASLLNNKLKTQVKMNLREISEQNEMKLHIEIRSQETTLLEIAERIGSADSINMEKAVEILDEVTKRYPFKRMGIAGKDGNAYTTDRSSINVSEREYFQKSLQGESFISNRLVDYNSGENIVVFSTPVYQNAEVKAVLFATYSTSSLREILTVMAFNAKNDAYIIDAQGNIIVQPEDGVIKKENIYDFLIEDEDTAEQIQQMKERIQKRKTGYIQLYAGTDNYMQYTPMHKNDWYLLNIVPANAMDKPKDYIMKMTYILCGSMVLLFGGLIIYIGEMDRKKKQQLENILYVDSVTGEYSYQYFYEKGKEILRKTNKKAAFIAMDIDDFKLINELFGNRKGDEVLCYISQLWKSWIQGEELFARREADRFIVLAFYKEEEEIIERIKSFTEVIRELKTDKLSNYVLRPKFGIYYIQDNHEDMEKIQNYALMAYSTAKKEQGILYAVYDDNFKRQMLEQKIMEDKIEKAYENREFIVYYQPKYDAKTCKIAGAEALIRWQKPDGTLIPPFRFIPIAEKSGFIINLDQYVFSMVCEQQKKWKEEGRELLPISVNLSKEHLKGEEFIEQYCNIWKESDIPIDCLELEITESAIFENQGEFKSIVDKLHKLGFRILMDDFGTGYSSLMMLKTIPIDVMKLDKSFVDDYKDSRGKKIINCVVQLAKSMDISITAEGVEQEDQYEFMKDLGCNEIQGYYFAKPMPVEEFEILLNGTDAV